MKEHQQTLKTDPARADTDTEVKKGVERASRTTTQASLGALNSPLRSKVLGPSSIGGAFF